MELRVLRYFLEVARVGNLTSASKMLHVSQPSLSRQLKDLEYELDTTLYERTNHGIRLTEAGELLKRRAEDILGLTDKTLGEFKSLHTITGGDIRIGCAESIYIKYLTDTLKDFRDDYPDLHFHILSGDTSQVADRLDNGLLDFAVIAEPPDLSKYYYIKLPDVDRWGLVMLKDHELAKKDVITCDDLKDVPLFASKQAIDNDFPRWCGSKMEVLNFVGTVNLCYNGSIAVRSHLGCLLTFEHLANVSEESGLCFRPLSPELTTQMYFIYRKSQIFSPIAKAFKDYLGDHPWEKKDPFLNA